MAQQQCGGGPVHLVVQGPVGQLVVGDHTPPAAAARGGASGCSSCPGCAPCGGCTAWQQLVPVLAALLARLGDGPVPTR